MSKIKNYELDQYGAEPFKRQQFGTASIQGVNMEGIMTIMLCTDVLSLSDIETVYRIVLRK